MPAAGTHKYPPVTCGYCAKEFRTSYPNRIYCSHKCYLAQLPRPIIRLRKTWDGMKSRCYNTAAKDFPRYGGRGIKICKEWLDFYTFQKWALAHGYADNLLIERKKNDGDYCPANCCFVTATQQARNRSNNHLITAFGETKTMQDWVEDPRCKVNKYTLSARITKQKLEPELAITHRSLPRGRKRFYRLFDRHG